MEKPRVFSGAFFDSVSSVTDGGELIGNVYYVCFQYVGWFLDLTSQRCLARSDDLRLGLGFQTQTRWNENGLNSASSYAPPNAMGTVFGMVTPDIAETLTPNDSENDKLGDAKKHPPSSKSMKVGLDGQLATNCTGEPQHAGREHEQRGWLRYFGRCDFQSEVRGEGIIRAEVIVNEAECAERECRDSFRTGEELRSGLIE